VTFQPSLAAADAGSWRMMKLGQPVSPTDVLRNGSQAMHAVDDDGVLVAGAGAHAWERLQIRRGAEAPPGRLCLRGPGHAQDTCTPRGVAAQTYSLRAIRNPSSAQLAGRLAVLQYLPETASTRTHAMPGVSDHMLAALSASQAAPLPLHRPRACLLELTALARGRSLDAALMSPGRRTPFPTLDPAYVDMSQGVSFCLANNIWGTNCARPPMSPHSSVHACQGAASEADLRAVAGAADVMWTPYAEQPADMRFRFEIIAHDADTAAGAGASAAGVTAPGYPLLPGGAAVQGAPAPVA